jgi:RimJ/RimL family protein N-acetyltransferase
MGIELIEITEKGIVTKSIKANRQETEDLIDEIIKSTIELYAAKGYSPPWIGYLAMEGGQFLGTCAFKAPPENNRTEIAYFTFPGYEGKGIATEVAKRLIQIGFETIPELLITAQTLPGEGASTAILNKLGFKFAAEVESTEDGKVWEWELENPEKT